ncbi:MAG: TrkH family potassium uptake protein [Halodesulfurarchaeum sp.]
MSWNVEWRASLASLGTMVKFLSLSMLVPLFVGAVYGEDIWVFGVSIVVTAGAGLALEQLDSDPDLGPREALLLVSLAWTTASIFGAIPFLLAGIGTESTIGLSLDSTGAAFASIVNALFESASGFTTTGATVLGEISLERHSHAVLLWRQLIQWLGGMGIIVLMIAILPELAVNGAQLMQSEAPGPDLQKLTPKIAETARALWLIYFGFTVLLVAALYGLHLAGLAPNMNLFNAVSHAFSALPTGGFSPKARSIAAFSAAVQWVIIPFLVVAGTNFALFWHVLRGEAEHLYRNSEFRAYAGAIAVFAAILSVLLVGGAAPVLEIGGATEGLVEPAIRTGAFQIVSLLNSTGFATANYVEWSHAAQLFLLLAMFVGGSAGSTGGGIKVVRWLVVLKAIRRQLYTTAHPEVVEPVRLAGSVVEEDAIRGILTFTVLYLVLMGVSAVFFSLDAARVGIELTAMESIGASVATLGNIGPGFGRLGPFGSYEFFPETSKLVMTGLMWVGRLEIVPVLAIFVSGIRDR